MGPVQQNADILDIVAFSERAVTVSRVDRWSGATGKSPAQIDDVMADCFSGGCAVGHTRQLNDQEVSFVCVPIVIEEEVVGTLSFDLRLENTAGFLPQCEHFLSIVATMIAADIKAHRLTAAEREKLEAENLRLRDVLEDYLRPENMVGNSRVSIRGYPRSLALTRPYCEFCKNGNTNESAATSR